MIVKFYPIGTHLLENDKGITIIYFAYRDNGKKVAVKFPYYYSFYVDLVNNTYEQLRLLTQTLSGVRIREPDISIGETIDSVIEKRYSTLNLHREFPVVRVFADTIQKKRDAVRIFGNYGFNAHEFEDELTPILKFGSEFNIPKYSWLSCECNMSATQDTKFEEEYVGNPNTLKTHDQLAPQFSIFSYDLETNSSNPKKMPIAAIKDNYIAMASITYTYKNIYKEYVLILNVDIREIYERYSKTEIESGIVTIYVAKDELDLIMRFFKYIDELDPDVITGHNIMGFDNPFIIERHSLLVKLALKSNPSLSVKIPNISRLKNSYCPIQNVKWNNSQVSMSGLYITMYGRMWIDSLCVIARGLFGQMPDGKLNTLAREHLSMEKDDVEAQDMFKAFRLFQDYLLSENPTYPYRDNLYETINTEYIRLVKKHNKSLPVLKKNNIVLHDVNNLISLYNNMNQRGKKIKQFLLSDEPKINLTNEYNNYYDKCKQLIDQWNITIDKNLSPLDKIRVMWWIVAKYCLQDTRIPQQALTQQNIVGVLREQSNVFCTDLTDVLMRGQMYMGMNAMNKYHSKYMSMMEPGPQGGPIPPYEYGGGLVGDGKPGLKIPDNDSIVFVGDFQSLYPTIIMAYNICITTWVPYDMRNPYLLDDQGKFMMYKGEKVKNPNYIYTLYESKLEPNLKRFQSELDQILQHGVDKDRIKVLKEYISELQECIAAPYEKKGDLMCFIHNIPNEYTRQTHVHHFIKAWVKDGILPIMLWDSFVKRKDIKKRMEQAKKDSNWDLYRALDAQQLAVKIFMNSVYGGLGTKSNKYGNFACAETVTFIGRSSITKVNEEVIKRSIGTVVYNDTDSAMIRVDKITERFNRDYKKIKEYCENVVAEISTAFRYPMGFAFENIFLSYFLKGPKMYAGIKCDGKTVDLEKYTREYVKMNGLLYLKGMVPVRRDKFKLLKNVFSDVLFCILTRQHPDISIDIMERAIIKIWSLKKGFTNKAVVEEMLSYNKGITPKSEEGGDGTMAKWSNYYYNKYGSKPTAGERFKLVVKETEDGKHTGSAEKLVTVDWLIEEKSKIDVIHYITAFGKDGSVAHILNIAYPDVVDRKCIENWYIKKLKQDGHLD